MKALLGYGARLPKELMLFVKNMVFLDGAIATLAPDLDICSPRSPTSPCTSPSTHGERIADEVGIDPRTVELDLDGVKASFGVDAATEPLTYRELQERRELIRERMQERRRAQIAARRQGPAATVAAAPRVARRVRRRTAAESDVAVAVVDRIG